MKCARLRSSSMWESLLWLVVLFFVGVEGVTDRNVCIIGSGIGGSATAKFLHDWDPSLHLHVFEQRSEIGGRTKTVKFDVLDMPVDAGASIVHKDNRYNVQFAHDLKLQITTAQSSWGIYDGRQFVFESSGSDTIDAGKLWWRYGNDLMKMQKIVGEFLEKFDKVYTLQRNGNAFNSPKTMLDKLGLYDLTQMSLEKMMIKRGIARKLIDELMAAVNRVNYGQNCTLNALAGMVGLAGAGSDLRIVKGGFQQISNGLMRLSKAEISTDTSVAEIERRVDGGFTLKSERGGDVACNVVVIAAPLEQSALILPSTAASVVRREFQLTQTTFLTGTLKASYFGKTSSVPSAIYTTENEHLSFTSIGCYTPDSQMDSVYKIFSRAPLTDAFLNGAFKDAKVLMTIPWKAYPHFSPPERFTPFVLEKGLIYINAIESAASAMEVLAVGAKNAALLVQQHLESTHPKDHTSEEYLQVEL